MASVVLLVAIHDSNLYRPVYKQLLAASVRIPFSIQFRKQRACCVCVSWWFFSGIFLGDWFTEWGIVCAQHILCSAHIQGHLNGTTRIAQLPVRSRVHFKDPNGALPKLPIHNFIAEDIQFKRCFPIDKSQTAKLPLTIQWQDSPSAISTNIFNFFRFCWYILFLHVYLPSKRNSSYTLSTIE